MSLRWYILHLCPMFGFVQSSDLYTSFFIVAFPSLHHSWYALGDIQHFLQELKDICTEPAKFVL